MHIREWAATAARNEMFVYYTGMLGADSDEVDYKKKPTERAVHALTVGDAAWRLYEAGQVLLVQKRLAPNRFEYRAIKT